MSGKQLRFNFLLPFPVTKPVGGPKVMYEYANRLAARGHSVTLLHPIARPYKTSSTPIWLKRVMFALRRAARPTWFPLRKDVESRIIPSAEARYVDDADASLCTWWEMAYMLDSWPDRKGAKFNLIQDYEVWNGQEELVKRSYQLPLNHICISRYLQTLVAGESGVEPTYLPNAIDTRVFFEAVRQGDRNPQSLIMLYSTEPRKGTAYGIEAVKTLKKMFPALKVTFFGVVDPQDLPDWVAYRKKPKDLAALYNQHAIFLSPSLAEGWALPPAEAMSCGCAVVCTDIGGHKDYAIHEKTALLAPPKSGNELALAVARVLNDNHLHLRLAAESGRFIRETFNWEKNVDRLLELIVEVPENKDLPSN